MKPVFFHVDLDAFFASVEQIDHPELAGKAVVIGAAPGHRGVVSACSYEARKYGVHSAMPISEAYRRCPHAAYLPVRMKRYHELSVKVIALFGSYTPDVRQISIDEASLDMTGTERLFGAPQKAARMIKARVRSETGLTISIGIAPNRYLAKLASEYDKPDGLFEVREGEEISFLDKLELRDLWGLGKKTLARLEELGVTSVPALRTISLETLQANMGKAGGSYLYTIIRGNDPGIYQPARRSHSISNESTFETDTDDPEQVKQTLLQLSHQVMFRMMEEGAAARTVFIKVRFADFRTTTVQRTLPGPPNSAEEIFRHASEMLSERWHGGPLRLLGVGLSASLEPVAEETHQGELFEERDRAARNNEKDGSEGGAKRHRLEEAVLRMKRDGKQLTKASLLKKPPRE